MNEIKVLNNKYILIKNYKDAFDLDAFTYSYTNFFRDYDYLVGDISYSKLRLKGFYNSNNKKAKKINDYKYLNKYLKEDCAPGCKYFVLKKVN